MTSSTTKLRPQTTLGGENVNFFFACAAAQPHHRRPGDRPASLLFARTGVGVGFGFGFGTGTHALLFGAAAGRMQWMMGPASQDPSIRTQEATCKTLHRSIAGVSTNMSAQQTTGTCRLL